MPPKLLELRLKTALRMREELIRLSERFDDLSRRFTPISVCLVEHWYDTNDDPAVPMPEQKNGFLGPPPPGKWAALVEKRQFVRRFVNDWFGVFVERSLIYCAEPDAWAHLTSLAAQASRCLLLLPRAVWHREHAVHTSSLNEPDGWPWLNYVFETAWNPKRDYPLPFIDNDARGGIFLWGESSRDTVFTRDLPTVEASIAEAGRKAAVITDIATQSYHCIALILDRLPPDGKQPDPRPRPRYTKEEKIAWWYEWVCEKTKEPLSHAQALDCLKEVARQVGETRAVYPPWSPDICDGPRVENLSLESFIKYLERVESSERKKSQRSDVGSVVRQLSASRPPREHDRVVPAEAPTKKHARSGELRAAASDQKLRDQQAQDLGYDIEPAIDSQGDPT